MNKSRLALIVAAVYWGTTMVSGAATQNSRTVESADGLFKTGNFGDAEKLYAKVATEDPKHYQAALRLGQIALLGNKLDDAQKWLAKAMALKREENAPKALLAEVYYRRDDFAAAASLFAAAGREAKAKKLESFTGSVPYQIEGGSQITSLKFINTDPLPLVKVRVNGSEEVNFLIDTGGGEVIIDTEFARKIGARQFGAHQWTFGGDQKADMGEGRVDSLMLGDFRVKNVPVNILSTRRFAAAANGKPVDGIIGTIMLYHFVSTLDYPNGELNLRRRTAGNLKRLEQQSASEKQIVVPFWLAGDHLMLAWGTLGKSKPVLFYVDTGLAGAAFTGPQSIIDEAGIQLPAEALGEGEGGGGKMKITPFVVSELSLGEARGQNLTGIFGPFPASIENSHGFRVGGLISHQFFKPYALTFDFDGMRFFLKSMTSKRSSSQASQADRFTAAAKKLVDAINAADYEGIVSQFGSQMRQLFPLEKARTFFQSLISQRGKILRADDPRMTPPNMALFLVHFERAELDMKLYLDEQNHIAGLGFTPVEQGPGVQEKKELKASETQFRVPFSGSWLVQSGGDTSELNDHHDAPNQAFAFDFVGIGPDGKTFAGDGKRNEDYYGFGREMYATADGVVTDVIEGVRDSLPNSPNLYSAMGNAVFIEHRPGEVSVYAHLKLGSTRVKAGDRVKAGQVIGLCGHSGGGKIPHLHYHLQDTPVFQDGKGIKLYFQNILVTRDGKTQLKERYSPIRGDIVSPK